MLTWDEIQAHAVAFSKRWSTARNEEAEAQGFQMELLRIFGVDDPMNVGDSEYKVPLSDGGLAGFLYYKIM